MPKPWLRLVRELGLTPRLLPINPNTRQMAGKANFSWMRTRSLRASLVLLASSRSRYAVSAWPTVMVLASVGSWATSIGSRLKG